MKTDLPTKQIQHDLCDICVLSMVCLKYNPAHAVEPAPVQPFSQCSSVLTGVVPVSIVAKNRVLHSNSFSCCCEANRRFQW
jgi:hypothetical protein